jgi:transposase
VRGDRPHPWSADDDRRLAKLYEDDELGPLEIAQRLGRSAGSVRGRLTRLRKDGTLGPARGHGGRSAKGGGS